MGKIYDLLIEPFVNIVEKRRSQREVALREGRPPTDALAVNQGNRATPAVLTQRDEATSEELSRKEEEECLTCKVIAISTLMMYGTAIILIPTTEKYKQSMKKYLANKNYVLLIFAVHSFVGSGKWQFNAYLPMCMCGSRIFFSGDSILRTGGGSVPIWIILFGGKGVSRPNVMLIVNLIRPNPPTRSAHVYIASTNASGFILW